MITTANLSRLQPYSNFYDNVIFIVNNNEIVCDESISIRLCHIYSHCEITHIAFKDNNMMITINYNNQTREFIPFTSSELLSLLDNNIQTNNLCHAQNSAIEWVKINPTNNSVDFGDIDFNKIDFDNIDSDDDNFDFDSIFED